MKASEIKLIQFLEGHDKRFVIPVYQRNYDWSKPQCKQLFDDLADVAKNKRTSHFFGSIVYIDNADAAGGKREYIIIDGQQRITTLTLLLLALIHEQEENQTDNDIPVDLIRDEYLLDKYNQDEKVKLKPVKNDAAALGAVFKKNTRAHLDSNVVANYLYFRKRIQENTVSRVEIYNAIKKLDVVDIRLKIDEDDPQLIFESLNSTGLDLTEADKVRNFILMSLDAKRQEEYYEKYWNQIETLTMSGVSDFIRDFLTYKERSVPNIKKVYFAFKEYRAKHGETSIESILAEMLAFAGYYHCIITANHPNKKVKTMLEYLNRLDMSVAYPFILEVFHDSAKEHIIDEDALYEILTVLESFLVRRFICDVPTNALNKMFAVLGREIHDIKDFPDYKTRYVDVFKYILAGKAASQRFPQDAELLDKMPVKDFYNMQAKNKVYIFERLENYDNKEIVDLQKLLDSGSLTFEHIMPQTLSPKWKEELGADWERIHTTYLNTIGNLTLTAYNSEYGNKSFAEKKTMNKGFNESKLFLNDSVKSRDTWSEVSIQERAKTLSETAVKTWRYCDTDYHTSHEKSNVYGVDDIDFTGTKPKSFSLRGIGEDIRVENWADLYKKLMLMLYDLDSVQFRNLLFDYDMTESSKRISQNATELRVPLQIVDDLFMEWNLSADGIVRGSKIVLQKISGVEPDDLSIHLVEKREESHHAP